MIKRLINGLIWLVGLSVMLFVFFAVPVGRHTLFQHTLRIAETEPAQELGEDLSNLGEDLGHRAAEELERHSRDVSRQLPDPAEAVPELSASTDNP